nr:MAG TPA: hypothetical protein [Caudoviricetes sp.]
MEEFSVHKVCAVIIRHACTLIFDTPPFKTLDVSNFLPPNNLTVLRL